ncbi:class I SAM-dependent methyltransferase [Nocardioides zeae]|uniref:SAM-dependent methyltransferase n=1 Tax=Nocardioides zeae TaxID=1457234 RepID=A0AAJ1TV47_9ACTN|nr:class I SAM-dependent methyltransferase [Nocardioides zeae]MDQ1102856.1 SAM-dependent methyltransferase [Nocardioides zeae]
MTAPTAGSTSALYESFPYPSPDPAGPLISDTALGLAAVFGGSELTGWRVLDLGCGTGHRLVATALQHPEADFVGLDASARSIEVATELVARHGVSNVELVHGSVPDAELTTDFDLVVSTGVLHHLPEPKAALRWAIDQLADDGLIYVWMYGALGEHDRLLDRELVRELAGPDTDAGGLAIVRELGLSLPSAQYGDTSRGDAASTAAVASVDADAYLNPIVNAVRFDDIIELFAGQCVDWLSVVSINNDGSSRLVDLTGRHPLGDLAVSGSAVLPDGLLRERYETLGPVARLRVIELMTKPTGVTVVAGRGDSIRDCAERIVDNVLVGSDGAKSTPQLAVPHDQTHPGPNPAAGVKGA